MVLAHCIYTYWVHENNEFSFFFNWILNEYFLWSNVSVILVNSKIKSFNPPTYLRSFGKTRDFSTINLLSCVFRIDDIKLLQKVCFLLFFNRFFYIITHIFLKSEIIFRISFLRFFQSISCEHHFFHGIC